MARNRVVSYKVVPNSDTVGWYIPINDLIKYSLLGSNLYTIIVT
jgi:hypothetical protein